MFSGLVEEIGRVLKLEPLADALRLEVGASRVLEDVSLGDSIAVNGVCLTVTDFSQGSHGDHASFSADVMQESLDRTGLRTLKVGDPVNLERALRVDSRLGGHIMQGHVDGVGTLLSRATSENWEVLRFSLPAELDRYVVEKGSIALDGTSLTVSAVGTDAEQHFVEVSLIPTTLQETTHGSRPLGSVVNIEVDVLGKYVEKQLAHLAGLPGKDPRDARTLG